MREGGREGGREEREKKREGWSQVGTVGEYGLRPHKRNIFKRETIIVLARHHETLLYFV